MKPSKLASVVALWAVATCSVTVLANTERTVGAAPSSNQQSEARPPAPPLVQLKVTVVISRFQGEKKVSNLPYTFWMTSNSGQSVRVGSQVPIVTAAAGTGIPAVNYQNVGLSIDCRTGLQMSDGRFNLNLSISDSQVNPRNSATPQIPTPEGAPIIQNFTTRNDIMLRDGQTAQINTATDKVTGEVIKVDVTLEVIK